MHDTFVEDLLTTIIPTVEQRTGFGRTVRIGPSPACRWAAPRHCESRRHLDLFAYMGVFSMGLQEGHDAGVNSDFEERNADFFADPDKTNELREAVLRGFWRG